jgi:hypothetical protein
VSIKKVAIFVVNIAGNDTQSGLLCPQLCTRFNQSTLQRWEQKSTYARVFIKKCGQKSEKFVLKTRIVVWRE